MLSSLFGKKTVPTIKFKNLNIRKNNQVNNIEYAMGKVNKAQHKKQINKATVTGSSTTFYIEFDGDKVASNVKYLRDSVSAVCDYHEKHKEKENIEVAIRISSPGGEVTAYAYASSLIESLRSRGIYTVAIVDTVAASGGYMMATSCDDIYVSPMAYVGSVGVVAEFPNFSEVLERLGIKWIERTAGNSKRSLGTFTESTEEKEAQFDERIKNVHDAFIRHVSKTRINADVEEFSTGKVFLGEEAVEKGLADSICNSHDYISRAVKDGNYVVQIEFPRKETKSGILSSAMESILSKIQINFK